MKRFGCLVLVCVCVCVSAVTVPRIAFSRNASQMAALFTYPDGSPCTQPCMFGVRLGQTRQADAITLLKSHPLLQTYDVLSIDPFIMQNRQEKTAQIRIAATADGLVQGIAVTAGLPPSYFELTDDSYPGSIQLGDAMSLLGNPDRTIIYGDIFH